MLARELFMPNQDIDLQNKIECFIKTNIQERYFPEQHDLSHFMRVIVWGLALSRYNEAKGIIINNKVVVWFGLLHDICRESDFDDKEHGLRAACYVKMIRNTWLGDLNDNEILLLSEAVKYHNKIRQYGEITIDTCFDADRLDLLRFGITVNPERLATNAAKQFLIGYNGDRDFFTRAFLSALKRLKFNDYYFRVKSSARIAVRVNIDICGFIFSPFLHTSWETEKNP